MWEIIKRAGFYIFCMVSLLIITVSSIVGIGYISAQITGLPIFISTIIFNTIFYGIVFIAFVAEMHKEGNK